MSVIVLVHLLHNTGFICPIIGQDRARLIEAALKLASDTLTNGPGVFRTGRTG